jgi:hypothetical protein
VPAASGPPLGRQLETSVPGYGGIASATGSLAQSAPTWMKLAVLPVGATALAQDLIDHPGATISAGAHDVKNAATTIASGAKSAAVSIYHSVAGLL